MIPDQDYPTGLPLRRYPSLEYALSFLILILMAIASILGLIKPQAIYPSEDLLQSFLPNDVLMLFIGVPILLGSIWLTRRGRLVGLLLWPGALFFVLYNYLTYTLAMPLNVAYLLHLTLLALSGYTLIVLLACIDSDAVQNVLNGAIPGRLAGGILAGLGLLFFLRAFGVMLNAATGQIPMSGTDFALNTTDFLIAPAWIICGALLWRRKSFGFVAGLGMLFQASMLFIGLILFMLLQPFLTNASFAPIDAVLVFAMGLICFIPFAYFLRGVVLKSRS